MSVVDGVDPSVPFDVASHDEALKSDAGIIAQLRTAVATVPVDPSDESYWRSDHALHRFLVARDRNVEKAAAMYKMTMQHRSKFRCGNILEPSVYSPPEVMRKCFPWGVTGVDKQGFPVLVERIGAIDLVGMQASIGPDDFLQWVCWYHEVQERFMRRLCAKSGKNRHKVTCIIDLGGVSFRHISSSTLDIVKRRARLEEDNYPEVVKRVFLINAPTIFLPLWGVVSLFVDPGTRDKMRVLGSNFLPTLRQFIDDDVIPAYLGGSKRDVDGDPECRALVCPGGLVPLSYIAGVAGDRGGLGEEVSIAAGRHADTYVLVPTGATVRWAWGTGAPTTAKDDVDFSVAYVAASPEAKTATEDGSATAKGVLVPQRSILGIQQLHVSAGQYKGPIPHGLQKHETAPSIQTPGPVTSKIPLSAADAAIVESVHSLRVTHLRGELRIPDSVDPAANNLVVVRLRWSNAHAWMHAKTMARRVDVLFPGDKWADIPPESDPAERLARAREQNMESFGL